MRLTLHTDYMLRVLFYAAAHPQRRVTKAEIARHFRISDEHLRKVIHALGRWGYIRTFQGKAGGLELRREPKAINIGDLVARSEKRGRLVDCTGQFCVLYPRCTLLSALDEAQDAFYQTLNRYTLADLLAGRRMRNQLLADTQANAAALQ